MLSIILNDSVEPESGVAMLNNIVDNIEHCWQYNVVQSSFHHLEQVKIFCRVE